MNPKSVLRGLLGLPYLGWMMLVPDTAGRTAPSSLSSLSEVLFLLEYMYLYGIVIWGVPYTILVGVLWRKSGTMSLRTFTPALRYTPCLLAVMIVVEVGIASALFGLLATNSFGSAAAAALLSLFYYILPAGLTILYGYFFVAIGSLLYMILESQSLLKIQAEAAVE